MNGALTALGIDEIVAGATPNTMTENRPGLVVGLYRGGELEDSWAVGNASLEYSVPISGGTVFDIASCSKQFTATAALLLVQDGVVELDVDVRKWVPELHVPDVTLRRCLTHTTGLNDYMTTNELAGRSLGDMVDQRDFLRWLGSATTTCFAPGDSIRYSNTGYVLAALLLSRASGQPFAELMRARVFDRLGMSKTRLHDHVGVVVPDMAFSYALDGDRLAREEMVECQVGDGAVLTTVEDLAAWHRFLLDGHELGSDVREALLTRARLESGAECGYAMGIQHRQFDGVSAYGHGGAMYGYRAAIVCLPSLGTGISVLANWGDLPVQAIAGSIVKRVVRQNQRRADQRPEAPPAAPAAGRWVDVDGARVLDLEVADGSVTIEQLRLVLKAVDGIWRDDYDDFALVVGSTTLTLIDRMGSAATLRSTPPPTVDPASLRGQYRAPDLDTDVIVEAADGGTGTHLRIAGGATWQLHTGYELDGSDLFPTVGGGVLVRRPGRRLMLSIWDVAVELVPHPDRDG